MKNSIRVRIDEKLQKEIFTKFVKKFKNRFEASKHLKITISSLKNYKSVKTKYLLERVVSKVCKFLEIPLPMALETTTLKKIRQTTIKKTYPVLNKKYGPNWRKVLAKRGQKTIKKIYGNNWQVEIAKSGYETCKKKYGENFQKVIWQKAIKSLEKRYGKNWAKINAQKSIKVFKSKYGENWANKLMANARKSHLEKYGKDWAKILSKKGAKQLERKYGKNYHKKLYKLAKLQGKHPLSHQEELICKCLKDKDISFETHCVKNNKEYDIVIPDIKNPEIVIESSNINPTTHNQRHKILQLLEQKENFPNSISIAVLKRRGKYNNFNHSAYNFLIDQNIFVFWEDDLESTIEKIEDYLKNKNKDLVTHRYIDFDYEKTKHRSLAGAIGCKNKLNKDELKLHRLLKDLNVNSSGPCIIKTKYENHLIFDDFENINGIKICYEVTSSKEQNALCYLAGKIAYIKKIYDDLNFIVILSERNLLLDRFGDNYIKKYADVIILKKEFNKDGLVHIRKGLLKRS